MRDEDFAERKFTTPQPGVEPGTPSSLVHNKCFKVYSFFAPSLCVQPLQSLAQKSASRLSQAGGQTLPGEARMTRLFSEFL